MDQIVKRAYGKINLGLDVLRKREDGYHDVKMIMQTVDLYDTLHFTKSHQGIVITTNLDELLGDQNNLIYKTAALMMETYEIQGGVTIHLEKRIPIAAGMAGGSADAAATFLGMNELFELHKSKEELMALGVKIGADVPYCMIGGTALAQGIGEILSPLSNPPSCYLLIAKPDIDVSTAFVYGNLSITEETVHPNIDAMITAIEQQDLNSMAELLGNVLETVTIQAYPVISELKQVMKEQGALNALMSGSGPTVFGIFQTKEKVEQAYEVVNRKNLTKQCFVSRFHNEGSSYGP